MRFSIVVPVYNNPVDLAACLDSLARLRYPKQDLEVIVVDNGSTDETARVARGFGVAVLVESEIRSSYAARNRGIRAAVGEFIAFTDSDCVVDEHWLAEIDAAIDDRVGCVAGEILSVAPTTLVERFSDDIGLLRQRGPLSGWHFKPYAQTANAVYRKRVFDEIGLFDPSTQSGGDAVFAWRMQDRTSYMLKFVPTAIVHHHHRASVPELWKQFRRYGSGKMSWALAQPDYVPPVVGKLEAEAVAALDKAIAAMERAGTDEKDLVFPVLHAASQMAHLSGYLQDLLAAMSAGLPLDAIPNHARKLGPRCNICGATTFIPGPGNRMVAGRAPRCADCGSLERHRVLAARLGAWKREDLACRSAISVGEDLPRLLARRFRSSRSVGIGEVVAQGQDMVIVPRFASVAEGRDLVEVLGRLASSLTPDGALILIDRADTPFEAVVAGTKVVSKLSNEFGAILADIMPNAAVKILTERDNIADNFYKVAYISAM